MISRTLLATAAVAALACIAACSGPASQPAGTTTPTASSATTVVAPTPCAELFKLGQPVTAGLEAVQCQDPNGLVGVNHHVKCADGRTMVFDSATNVYGWPGGVFAAIDTTAGSAYSADYAKCGGR